ncbi:MAG: HAMP domain-containing sensor histidine kinase [Candidatus Eiseniibacteriota bacterium]
MRGRLLASYAILIVAALAIMTTLASHEQRRWLIERQQEALEQQAGRVVADATAALAAVPERAPVLADSLGRVLQCRVTLMDRSGRVLGDSEVAHEALAAVENHAGRPEVRAALAGRVGHAMRSSRTVGRPLIYTAVPAGGGGPLAVFRLAEPLKRVDMMNASLLRQSLVAAAVALLISIPVAYRIASGQARRVRDLGRVAMRLGVGDAGARALERPADELGRLGHTINTLASLLRLRLKALEGERNERERILAHMSDGVALIGPDDRVVHANRSLATILGAPLPPAAGTLFQEFARSPELVDLLRAARGGEQPVELDLRLWTPAQRRVRATATHLWGDEHGSVILVLHDLTEIERLNQVRQDFVANVSHELKTPLTSVRGYAETLLDGGLDDADNRESFVRIIRDQAARLQSLVDDLLSLADLERPDVRLRREAFDLRAAVERQVAALGARAAQAGLTIALEPGPSAPVVADRLRIDQVVANLLDNAIKYTDRGGVRVRLGREGGRIWCEVEDTGAGIPAADVTRIFERFYRVDKARSREKGGTGLGLAIVRHILALHGGRVSVTSVVGRGSTFRFELPPALPGAPLDL